MQDIHYIKELATQFIPEDKLKPVFLNKLARLANANQKKLED